MSLRLRAAAGGGSGARLWTGGVLLAEWLCRAAAKGHLRLRGKRVVELGAGAAALPALACAKHGARSLATDGLQERPRNMWLWGCLGLFLSLECHLEGDEL